MMMMVAVVMVMMHACTVTDADCAQVIAAETRTGRGEPVSQVHVARLIAESRAVHVADQRFGGRRSTEMLMLSREYVMAAMKRATVMRAVGQMMANVMMDAAAAVMSSAVMWGAVPTTTMAVAFGRCCFWPTDDC
jgi:hypothetical protein